jgi:2'-5' RNA ligase
VHAPGDRRDLRMAVPQRLSAGGPDRRRADGGAPALRRLFVGLFPDAEVRGAIVAHRERWRWPPKSRLTSPTQLHLTLHFIGNVDAVAASELERALVEVSLPPLALVLAHDEVWRNGIAALLPEDCAALRVWRAALALPLQRAGLALPEFDWTPHLTLAREAASAVAPDTACRIRWPVRHGALVWSRPGSGEGYLELARFPARPAGAG